MTTFPSIDTAAVLSWYTGKSLEKAKGVLGQVMACVAQGYWSPGVSRAALATLTKANVAAKAAKAVEAAMEEIKPADYYDLPYRRSFFDAHHTLRFGHFMHVGCINIDALRGLCVTPEQKAALAIVEKFVRDMAPLGAATKMLDARRPPPVITSLGASPTVTATLRAANMDSDSTFAVCPVRWEERQEIGPNGEARTVMAGVLEWPAGTQHNTSRHASGNRCHACGHAIRNALNWIPLVLTGADATPRSFWVGQDCAKTLFGVSMKGEAAWSEIPVAK